ncbi:MAG: hypothetical protein J5I90_09125 [Caldilineales bacterium]|nr:hypothetical protein [Caldilineales bacterium]
MSKTVIIIIGIVVIAFMAGGSFYAGTVYGQQQAAATQNANFTPGQGHFPNNGNGAPGDFPQGFPEEFPQGQQPNRFGGAGGGTFGQIEQIDGDTLTISTQNSGEKQVIVTDTTLIEKNTSVGVSDLETGESVIISGSENDDGSITARSIQVAPAGRFGAGLPGGPGNQQQ